jgi:hypothetical protein
MNYKGEKEGLLYFLHQNSHVAEWLGVGLQNL